MKIRIHSGWAPAMMAQLLVILATTPVVSQSAAPKIVNGAWTQARPSTVAITSPTGRFFCTGTLVGCQSVISAGHCFDGATPEGVQVYSQHGAARAAVASISVHPGFGVEGGRDIAVLKLKEPLTGIEPTPINDHGIVPPGSPVTTAGFGVTGDLRGGGIKRTVDRRTAACPPGLENEICAQFLDPREGGSACFGDSGGPTFFTSDGETRLAAVTSRGSSCTPPGFSVDTSVYYNRDWLTEQIGDDLGTSQCGGVAVVGTKDSTVVPYHGYLHPGAPVNQHSFDLPAGVASLRLALNGAETIGPITARFRHGAPPTDTTFDCQITSADACEVPSPAAGTWYAVVSGSGEYQVTATELFTVAGNAGTGGLPTPYKPTDFCVNTLSTTCIDGSPFDRRFEISTQFTDPNQGQGAPQTAYSVQIGGNGITGGLSYFFDSKNPEVLYKILSGCAFNGHFWFFSSALTNVAYDLSVKDRQTGNTTVYSNPMGQVAQPVTDLTAFTCQ